MQINRSVLITGAIRLKAIISAVGSSIQRKIAFFISGTGGHKYTLR
jgi:hypothetical protein